MSYLLPLVSYDYFLILNIRTAEQSGRDSSSQIIKGGDQGSLPGYQGGLTLSLPDLHQEALANVLRKVAKEFKGDLIVTENGIATADDTRRAEFIQRALAGVQGCIADGLPVKGYMHWSLLDNFERQKGYTMTFGLIAVDRSTQTRYPKENLRVLGSYAPDRP